MNWKSKPKPKSYRFVLCCAVPQHLFCACISSCFYHSSKRDPAREGRSVERGGQSRRCNRHRPIFHSVLPCRSCPGCTAASCRLTHGPGQTDRDRQTRLPKCQESKSECPFLPFSFLSFPSSGLSQNLSLLMALQLTLCLHLQSARQNLRLSAQVAPLRSI